MPSANAAELVALAPDVILAGGGAVVPSLLQATRAIPIVFTQTPDPVGAGFVESLARPGGNVTGFTVFEYGIGAKWLELLKEIAPHVTRAAVIRDAAIASGIGQWGAIQTAAPSFGVELRPVDVRDASEIERSISIFARFPNGGLIVAASTLAIVHRETIITLAGTVLPLLKKRVGAMRRTFMQKARRGFRPGFVCNFFRLI
jgi:putative ABC transport system substrate-binding protein